MRLLLVEDDNHVAAALSAVLRRHGFDVTHARNGEEALRALVRPIGAVTGWFGTSTYLAVSAVRERTRQASTVTMPVVVLTGLAVGTLYIQQLYEDANAAAGVAVSTDDQGVQTLNLIIIGMISLFAAVVLVNNCVASLLGRRQEFGLTRKIGATPGSSAIRSSRGRFRPEQDPGARS